MRKSLILSKPSKKIRIFFDNVLYDRSITELYVFEAEVKGEFKLVSLNKMTNLEGMLIKFTYEKENIKVESNNYDLGTVLHTLYNKLKPIILSYETFHTVFLNNTKFNLIDTVCFYQITKNSIIPPQLDDREARLHEILELDLTTSEHLDSKKLWYMLGNYYPLIPIEFLAHSYYNKILTSRLGKGTFVNDLKNFEIEAKFEAVSRKNFLKIYRYFMGHNKKFRIEKSFPFIIRRSMLVSFISESKRYIFAHDNSSGKIRTKSFPFVYQELPILLRAEEDVPGLLKYRDLKPDSSFIKLKFAFWIENSTTAKLYHIVLDKEFTKSRSLSQLEIEYAGTLLYRSGTTAESSNKINEIVEDMSTVYKIISQDIGIKIKPTVLTKQEGLNLD